MALDFLGPVSSSLAVCGLMTEGQRDWVVLDPQVKGPKVTPAALT